ncbi:MAG: hypothetical protein ABI705_09315 [Aestuariivirga sp.]
MTLRQRTASDNLLAEIVALIQPDPLRLKSGYPPVATLDVLRCVMFVLITGHDPEYGFKVEDACKIALALLE